MGAQRVDALRQRGAHHVHQRGGGAARPPPQRPGPAAHAGGGRGRGRRERWRREGVREGTGREGEEEERGALWAGARVGIRSLSKTAMVGRATVVVALDGVFGCRLVQSISPRPAVRAASLPGIRMHRSSSLNVLMSRVMRHAADAAKPDLAPVPPPQVGLSLWVLSLLGRVLDVVTLLLLLHLGAFSVPLAYKSQQARVDKLVKDVYSQASVGRGGSGSCCSFSFSYSCSARQRAVLKLLAAACRVLSYLTWRVVWPGRGLQHRAVSHARSIRAAPSLPLQAQYEKVDRRVKAAAIVVLAAVLFFVLPAVDRFVALFMVLAYGRSILRPNEVRAGAVLQPCSGDGFWGWGWQAAAFVVGCGHRSNQLVCRYGVHCQHTSHELVRGVGFWLPALLCNIRHTTEPLREVQENSKASMGQDHVSHE